MTEHAKSGTYESLRARCSSCGEAIARHPYCVGCGAPRRCGSQDGWRAEAATLRCPDCVAKVMRAR